MLVRDTKTNEILERDGSNIKVKNLIACGRFEVYRVKEVLGGTVETVKKTKKKKVKEYGKKSISMDG